MNFLLKTGSVLIAATGCFDPEDTYAAGANSSTLRGSGASGRTRVAETFVGAGAGPISYRELSSGKKNGGIAIETNAPRFCCADKASENKNRRKICLLMPKPPGRYSVPPAIRNRGLKGFSNRLSVNICMGH